MSLLDKASLVQIPSGYKEDKLYSVVPDSGAGDFTFSRSSTGTRVNADGYIEEVPWNIMQYSEDYTQWAKSANNTLVSSQTSPINTNTAIAFQYNGTIAEYWILKGTTLPSANVTMSAYLKKGTKNWVIYRVGNICLQYFDIENEVLGNNIFGAPISYNFVNIGNDWVRLDMTVLGNGASNNIQIYSVESGTSTQVTGTSGDLLLYVWGAQVVKGNAPKPYIKTTDRLNVPRLDYSGSCASLLLEPQRTNIIRFSESFENSWWQKLNNVTVSGTKVTSPDGTLNASQLIFDGTTDGRIEKAITGLTSGADYSVSIYARVSSGTQVVSFGSVNVESFTLTTEWQRLTRTEAENDTVGYPRFICDDAATIQVWGFQLEQGSYPTSYIPSNSNSQTTRSADVCNNAGTAATFNSTEGVLFAEIAALANDGRIALNDGTANNNVRLVYNSSLNRIEGVVYNGANQAFLNYTLPSVNSFYKIAFKYKASDFSLYVNGLEVDNQIGSGVTFSENTLSQIDFDAGNGLVPFYGKTKQLIVFDEALSDEELSDLTGQVNTSFAELANFYNYTIL